MRQTLEDAVRSEDLDTDVALPHERPFWQDYLATVARDLPRRVLHSAATMAMYILSPVLGGLPENLQERLHDRVPEYPIGLAFVSSLAAKTALYIYAGWAIGSSYGTPEDAAASAFFGGCAAFMEIIVRNGMKDDFYRDRAACGEPLMWMVGQAYMTGERQYHRVARYHRDMVRLTEQRRGGK